MSEASENRLGFSSVERVLDILLMFAAPGATGNAQSIAEAFGTSRSSTYRYLQVLRSRGLIEEVGSSGDYRISAGFAHMVSATVEGISPTAAAEPVVAQLARTVGETTLFTVRVGDRVQCATYTESPKAIRVGIDPVRETPIHVGSSAKTHFAFLPERERRRILSAIEGAARTKDERRICAELAKQLEGIHASKVARSCGEIEDGVISLSVPVFLPSGALAGVLTIAAPTFRMKSLDGLLSKLQEAAREIELTLAGSRNARAEAVRLINERAP
jgi:DNA-binding IclR family transcriptional regulator